jgi:hypothetical protein
VRLNVRLYQVAVAAKEFFERVRIKPLVSLAKMAVAAVSRIGRVP